MTVLGICIRKKRVHFAVIHKNEKELITLISTDDNHRISIPEDCFKAEQHIPAQTLVWFDKELKKIDAIYNIDKIALKIAGYEIDNVDNRRKSYLEAVTYLQGKPVREYNNKQNFLKETKKKGGAKAYVTEHKMQPAKDCDEALAFAIACAYHCISNSTD
ncbi:MAG: hypothetical protein KFW21_05835 [Spirochaetota bacterium]|nr:hypothetical protein [Spirochaetota bacterium]